MSTTDFFYKNLPAFNRFEQILNEKNFTPIPADWYVIIVDIMGSTQAIEAGRYKDVNMIGASAIISVLNQTDKDLTPYIFGGDGASFAVPSLHLKKICSALYGVKQMSEETFNLKLRVGILPVQELYDQGQKITVCKFQAAPGIHLAMFSSGGIETAERKIKSPPSNAQYDVTHYCDLAYMEQHKPNFDGLECRWDPVKSNYGEHITLMLLARGSDKQTIYQNAYNKISEIYGQNHNYCPVSEHNLALSKSSETLKKEAKIKNFPKVQKDTASTLRKINWLQRIGSFLLKTRLKIGNFDGKSYKNQLIQNSDYRKFDDMLRMILDSTTDQKKQLLSYLQDQYQKQNIYYGIHFSDSILLTCLVFDYHDYHVHFVDGGNGGYAMAAKQLKGQVKKNAKPNKIQNL